MYQRNHRTNRRDSGAVMMLVALGMAFVLAAAAFGVDHGRITTNRRSLQKVADVVALDAVRAINGGTAAEIRGDVEDLIIESAIRNEYLDPGSYSFANESLSLPGDKSIEYVLGVYDTATETLTAAGDTDRPNAVRVSMADGFSYAFQPGDKVSTMLATALYLLPSTQCDTPPCTTEPWMSETFNIGSFVAGMNATLPSADHLPELPGILPPATQSAVERRAKRAKTLFMNAIYGRAFGRDADEPTIEDPTSEVLPDTQLGIDVIGYEGLANTTVTLDELRAVMGFGSVTELLDAQVSMRDFTQGLIHALQLPDPADEIPDTPYTDGLPGTTIPDSGIPQVDGRYDRTDTRIDGALERIKDRASGAPDLSAFDDPSATFLQPHADADTTAAAISALGKMREVTLPGKTLPPNATLREVIQVREGYDTSAADARLRVLDVIGTAALITGGNLFATDILVPVSSPNVDPSLPTTLSNRITALQNRYGGEPDLLKTYEDLTAVWPSGTELVRGRLQVAVIEPPDEETGPPGVENGEYLTLAETAQVNIGLELNLADLDMTPLLDAGSVPLLSRPSDVADTTLPFVISGGRATAGLVSMDCADLDNGLPSIYDVNTDAFEISLGKVADTSSLEDIDPTIAEAAMVESSSSLLELEIDGSATITLQGVSDPEFEVSGPYNAYNTYRVANDPAADLEQALLDQIDPLIPNLDFLSLLGNLAIVSKAEQRLQMSQIVTNRVPNLDYDIFRPLTSALGVGIGGADLTATAAQCGLRVLVD